MSTYNPTQFNEGAAPGISAAELNKMGHGIKDAHDELHEHETRALGVAGSHPMPTAAQVGAIPLGQINMAAGDYTGNGVDGRVITVGFTPTLVIINHRSVGSAWNVIDIGGVHHMTGSTHALRGQPKLVSNGFQLGPTANEANNVGYQFSWMAWGVAS